jgi:prepilin-type N-terminal cleavage/methylation domain-containing protein
MSPRKLPRNTKESGFTLIETMVAIVVLTIGLVSTAALMSTSVSTTSRSHYMSTAAMLATEKLEDLDRFNKAENPVKAAGGSLAADIPGFFDKIQISSDNGGISETTSSAAGSTSYTQTPAAGVIVTPGAGLPPATPDTLIFDRRWTVTPDVPVLGVRTVTVLVTLNTALTRTPVTFQMSVVRP